MPGICKNIIKRTFMNTFKPCDYEKWVTQNMQY